MIINNNIPALNTYRQMGVNQGNAQSAMEKLSSGLRINRAGDDAAGLAISEKMRAQVRGLDQASRNSQDGISMIQTAEGALQETHNILQRMRELATQAANDTNVEVDREEIQKEMNQLTSEINRIGNTTEFNTQKLLDGGQLPSTGQASINATTTSVEGITEVVGQYTFELASQPNAGETIEIAGETFTFGDGTGGTIEIGADIDTTAGNLRSAIDASSLGSRFENAAGSGAVISLEESVGEATGTNITVGGTAATSNFSVVQASVEEVTEVAGVYELTISNAFADGDTIEVGGNTYVYQSDGTGDFDGADIDAQATALASLIANETQFASATVSNGVITITEDAGQATGEALGVNLVGAGGGNGFSATFQIGANGGQSMTIDVRDMRATSDSLKVASEDGTTVTAKSGKVASYTVATDVTNGTDNQGQFKSLDVSSHEKATAAIDVINDAIESVSAERSKLGAYQNRLEHTISNLNNASENLQAAESRIRDVDMAREVMDMTKNNILAQASQAMLAQANQAPQAVLQLLG